MKLVISPGMAPAAEVDRQAQQWLCRACAGRRRKVVLIRDNTHPCHDCGQAITASVPVVEGVLTR